MTLHTMEEIKIHLKLPSEVTVNIPSFSDMKFEDVANVISKEGVALVKSIIKERILAAFVEKHEPYLQAEVERLLAEKEGEIEKLLNE